MVTPAEDYYPDHDGGECAPIEAATVKNITQWIEGRL